MWSKPSPRSAARSTASCAYLQVARERTRASKARVEHDTFGADVDSDHLGARPAQRVMGGLGGAAASNQYAAVVAIWFVRREEMGIGAPAMVIRELAVGLQIVDRRRVRMTLVEGGHLGGNGGAFRRGTSSSLMPPWSIRPGQAAAGARRRASRFELERRRQPWCVTCARTASKLNAASFSAVAGTSRSPRSPTRPPPASGTSGARDRPSSPGRCSS